MVQSIIFKELLKKISLIQHCQIFGELKA